MNLFKYLKGDKVIWTVMFLLSLLSILVVYSAVVTLAHKFKQGNSEYYLFKHFIIIALGFIVAYLFHKMRYTLFSKIAQIGIVLTVPLLVYTLLKGVSAGEASRWLEIPGIGLTFQSSDIAKLMLLIYLARVLTVKRDELGEMKAVMRHLLLPVGLVCALILPANFSTAALLFLNSMLLMFIGGINIRIILKITAVCFLAAALFITWIMLAPESIPGGRGPTGTPVSTASLLPIAKQITKVIKQKSLLQPVVLLERVREIAPNAHFCHRHHLTLFTQSLLKNTVC